MEPFLLPENLSSVILVVPQSPALRKEKKTKRYLF
jgi:hypothetical protein